MSVGLIALLDDVAFMVRSAAASLDDVAGQAAKAGTKAAGVVIDDAAVTPRYVVGFAAERELPIVGKIAVGSLRNKLLFLLPGALALSAAPPPAHARVTVPVRTVTATPTVRSTGAPVAAIDPAPSDLSACGDQGAHSGRGTREREA